MIQAIWSRIALPAVAFLGSCGLAHAAGVDSVANLVSEAVPENVSSAVSSTIAPVAERTAAFIPGTSSYNFICARAPGQDRDLYLLCSTADKRWRSPQDVETQVPILTLPSSPMHSLAGMYRNEHSSKWLSIATGLVGDSPLREGLVQGFLLILFSELGDKTFFLAVLLALKENKSIVFAGTFGALAIMTVISVSSPFQPLQRLGRIEGPLNECNKVIWLHSLAAMEMFAFSMEIGCTCKQRLNFMSRSSLHHEHYRLGRGQLVSF